MAGVNISPTKSPANSPAHPPRGRPRRLENRLRRQRAFVSAALTVCDRDGLQAITARNIGREIGLSAMAVYRYFDSMDHLLAAAWNECYRRVHEEMELACRDTVNAADELRCRLQAFLGFSAQHPGLFGLMVATQPRPEHFGMENLGCLGFKRLVALIRDGISAGIFRSDFDPVQAAMRMSYSMIGMATFSASCAKSGVQEDVPDKLVPGTIEWLIDDLR